MAPTPIPVAPQKPMDLWSSDTDVAFEQCWVGFAEASSPPVIGYLKFRIRLEMREGTERTRQLAV